MATWSTLTPSDLWGVVLEITSKYANKKLNLSNSHWGRAKVGGFFPILLMWNITHFNCGGQKYQHSEMSKWYSYERCLKKPGPMLARDQALSRRSRPYRRKDPVSKSDINTLTSYREFESRNRCWVSCTLPADPFLTGRGGRDSTEIVLSLYWVCASRCLETFQSQANSWSHS